MSKLLDDPRKVNLWHLLASTTGYSKVYCRKVMQGERNASAKGAVVIKKKYEELEKMLSK